MVTERQIIAILTVVGSITALGFAFYNLWENFKPNNSAALLAKLKTQEALRHSS